MKMEQTERSETLAFILQTPGNNPEESRRHAKHGEISKSRRVTNVTRRYDYGDISMISSQNEKCF
jgi:tRNA(Arg) A34 adenosine deaminase TadA